VIDAAKTSPGGVTSCPAVDVDYTLEFRPIGPQRPVLVTFTDGCFFIGVKVGSHTEPILLNNGQGDRIVNRLLHLSS